MLKDALTIAYCNYAPKRLVEKIPGGGDSNINRLFKMLNKSAE